MRFSSFLSYGVRIFSCFPSLSYLPSSLASPLAPYFILPPHCFQRHNHSHKLNITS
jgi:hypothetical protein